MKLSDRIARKQAQARRNFARQQSQQKIDALPEGQSFTDDHGTTYQKIAGTIYLSRVVDNKPICVGWIDPK